MLFKVVTVGRTEALIKKEGDPLISKTIMIPPKTILEVYACVRGDETRFVVWNEQLSSTFFTVNVNNCRPAY